MIQKTIKTDSEWKKILNPLQYRILRKGGTEKAFTGSLLNNKEKGVYLCVACGNPLYSSETKYNSGTGWPSFFAPFSEDSLIIKPIPTGIDGAEVLCAKCEGHHGHIFIDGPKPTGLRFCMNSVILKCQNIKKEVKEKNG
ncbi:peptide-methionine (R)-S-oxide reductase MsrB [Candidatus Pacearchaeota archaeon]|nr:peptide-methionine (R)-S-oxide reductase MsrB [Candidatus Pacearchaeota archaeon]